MILEFRLPAITPHMTEAMIEYLHTSAGSKLKAGDKLLDLSVDLSRSFAQDCPPISFFRVIVRESVVLRELKVVPGQLCRAGDLIAVFSSSADEPCDQPAQRGIRIATAGIIHHEKMRTGNNV